MLKKVRIKNFKSFKDVEIEFNNLNVLVGANASGKTNFLAYLEFMKEIVHKDKQPDLSRAIINQCGIAGVNYFLNTNIGTQEPFETEIVCINQIGTRVGKTKERIVIYPNEEIYKLNLIFNEGKINYEIIKEELTWKCGLDKAVDLEDEIYFDPKSLNQRTIILKFNDKNWEYYELMPDGKLEATQILQPLRDHHAHWDKLVSSEKLDSINNKISTSHQHKILLEGQGLFVSDLKEILRSISSFDIKPECKNPLLPMTNYEPLKKDGSNLILVLAYLLKDEEKKRTLFNLMTYVFPFFKELEIREVFENYIQLWMKEKYHKEAWIPSFLISDGTINIIAFLIALFFDDSKIVFIEEPDRYLHPYLISALVELLKEASEKKQIIITTHNPEILRYVDKKDILLVSRGDDGFSKISRPANKKIIQIFLTDELGMPELFIDNLLEMQDA